MYHPSLDQVKELVKRGNFVPIYRDIPGDLETPVSAYLKVAQATPSFLLESVEGGERLARYSFIGTEPYKVLRTGPGQVGGAVDPLVPIQQELSKYRPVTVEGLPRFLGGAVGYLAYEVVRYFERLPENEPDPVGLPESVFLFADTLLVFDHVKHTIKVVSHARVDVGPIEKAYREATDRIERLVARLQRPLVGDVSDMLSPRDGAAAEQPAGNISQEQHEANISKARQYIIEGECIQVVLSRRLSKKVAAKPFDIYRSLRAVNPSPYMFFMDFGDFQLVGASPEMLIRAEDGLLTLHPIAGTLPRGKDEAEDSANAQRLISDPKERAEHLMLLDLGRNDVGRVSAPGTVRVTQQMEIERYSHVMHIVSSVTGKLRPDRTVYDALRAAFPAGTVSGAPKVRAMEIIAELEPHQRGPYSGVVGYFSFNGNMDTAITLRTIVMKDGVCHVQAGGGIVYDSIPASEYKETLAKSAASLAAIQIAEDRALARAEAAKAGR